MKIVFLNSSVLFSSRLVQTEERQQLALLYKNIKVPLLGDEEKDSGQEESSYLLAKNEKNLAKFLAQAVITFLLALFTGLLRSLLHFSLQCLVSSLVNP